MTAESDRSNNARALNAIRDGAAIPLQSVQDASTRVDPLKPGDNVYDYDPDDYFDPFELDDEPDFDTDGEPTLVRSLIEWSVVVVVALGVAFLIRTFLLAHFVVDGTSMVSTLHNHDRVFVNKLSYDLHDPNRGDVVVLHERSGDRDLIKRVVALPGETVEMTNCEVRINGQILVEPYLDPTVVTPGNCGPDQPALLVPKNSVFVMGDNRPGSSDSRAIGPISYDDIVGRAFIVFWPFADWQWL